VIQAGEDGFERGNWYTRIGDGRSGMATAEAGGRSQTPSVAISWSYGASEG
jgi:hypothetical protein